MLKKPLAIAALIGLYLLVFAGLNFVHFQFVPVAVVFYAALFDAVFAAALVGLLLLVRRGQLRSLTGTEAALALCAGVLIGVIYAILAPTLVDRSLSLYMLEKLDEHRAGISRSALETVITRDYFDELRVIDARLTEQLRSGTVVIENGCVRVTPRGELVVRLSRIYRKHLLPKRREVMGLVASDRVMPEHDTTFDPSHACN